MKRTRRRETKAMQRVKPRNRRKARTRTRGMLRLTKMLRLGRLKRIFQRYHEQMQPYIKAIKLSGMVAVAFFLAHLLACLWYGVGTAVDNLYDQDGEPSVRSMLPTKLH